MIPAHDSPLAALAFDASGTKLATASEKVSLLYPVKDWFRGFSKLFGSVHTVKLPNGFCIDQLTEIHGQTPTGRAVRCAAGSRLSPDSCDRRQTRAKVPS